MKIHPSIRLLILLIFTGLLLVACGGSPADTPDEPETSGDDTTEQVDSSDNEEAGGDSSDGESSSIVMVIPENPSGINPYISSGGYAALMMEMVLLALTDLGPNGEVFLNSLLKFQQLKTEASFLMKRLGQWM